MALCTAALLTLSLAPAAQAEVTSGSVPEVYTDGATEQVNDPDIVSGQSKEFRSEKPNAQQELEKYLEGPKPAKHITRAVDTEVAPEEVGTSAAITPNPVTVHDCRAKFGVNIGRQKFWYRDRFNSCTGVTIKVKHINCSNGICYEVGGTVYRLIIVGHGTRGVNPDGSRGMKFQFFADKGYSTGKPNPPHDRVYHGFKCKAYTGDQCKLEGLAYPTVTDLLNGWQSDVITLTERNTSSLADNKIHYDNPFHIVANMGALVGEVQVLRSDTASYASGGGFVFMDVEPWFQYDFAADSYMYYQVEHIWDAHHDIANTKPGDPHTKVAGSRTSGMMLSRMYSEYDKTRYNRNNYIAVLTCKHHFGEDYASKKGPRHCDEYPYRSTFQGAAYTEYEGGTGIWSHSARPIPAEDNSTGGGKLNGFFRSDHIIHGDTYWVDVVGQPDPNKPELEY